MPRREPFGLVFLALVLVAASPADAHKTLYVNGKVARSGNGLDWNQAFKTIQEAIAAADNTGDLIFVAPGTYYGGFQVIKGVKIYGGFVPGQYNLFQRQPLENRVFLDGRGRERVVVLKTGGEIDGVHIINGRAGSPGGGGVLVDGLATYISGCVFRNCGVSSGGGAAVRVKKWTETTIENCIFLQAQGSGPVVEIEGTGGTYVNNLFYGNPGDGLRFFNGASPRIYDNAFVGNGGRGIADSSTSNAPVVENNHFFANKIAPYHYRGRDLKTVKDVNALSFARNNITGDPRFIDAPNRDFALRETSPLIDTGVDQLRFTFLDVNLRLRPFDDPRVRGPSSARDIGPHEWQGMRFHLTGSTRPGGTAVLNIAAPNDAGRVYQVGSSAGRGPVDVGARAIYLTLDGFLVVSVRGNLPWIFAGYAGRLNASGQAQAAIHIPAVGGLVGHKLHSALLILDRTSPFGIKRISRTVTLNIR